MAPIEQLEMRISRLEREVDSLRRHVQPLGKNWVPQMTGQMDDIPYEEFEEFARLGREFRKEQTDPAGP